LGRDSKFPKSSQLKNGRS